MRNQFYADPYVDDCDHGTGAASVALGATVGVAKGATLHSVRVATGCLAYEDDIVAGIDWVVANAVQPAVMNINFSTGTGVPLRDAVYRAVNSGIARSIPVSKAAGNGTSDACGVPANGVQDVLVVGATTASYARQAQSNYGPCVKIWAPGELVRTASASGPGNYGLQTGTSVSAPIVAGVVATLLPQLFAHEPNSWKPPRVWNIVRSSATSSPTVPLTDLRAGSPALFINSLHRFLTLDSGCSSDLFPRVGEPISCPYSVHGYGGDGTWSSYAWTRSWNGAAPSLVSTSAAYTASYPAGSYQVDYNISAASFGASFSFPYRVTVRPNNVLCTPSRPC